jgi:hypothetical protein
MTPAAQAVFSGFLTLGVPLIFAVRELMQLRRGNGDGGWRDDVPEPPPPPPTSSEPPLRPLPDCLIPKPIVSTSLPHAQPALAQPALAQPAPRVRELA